MANFTTTATKQTHYTLLRFLASLEGYSEQKISTLEICLQGEPRSLHWRQRKEERKKPFRYKIINLKEPSCSCQRQDK